MAKDLLYKPSLTYDKSYYTEGDFYDVLDDNSIEESTSFDNYKDKIDSLDKLKDELLSKLPFLPNSIQSIIKPSIDIIGSVVDDLVDKKDEVDPDDDPTITVIPVYPPGGIPGYPPGDDPSDNPGIIPGVIPGDIPVYPPGVVPSDPPNGDPGDLPNDDPGGTPGYPPSDLPSNDPSDLPGDTPGNDPSDDPQEDPQDDPSDPEDDKKKPNNVPRDPFGSEPTSTISIPSKVIDKAKDIERKYSEDLADILEDYLKKQNTATQNYINSVLTYASYAETADIKHYTSKTVTNKNLTHVTDYITKSKIGLKQRVRLYKKLFTIDETIFHLRAIKVSKEQLKRYSLNEKIEDINLLTQSANSLLIESRLIAEKKYEENFYGLYKYLNSSVIIFNECMNVYTKQKCSAILLNNEERE